MTTHRPTRSVRPITAAAPCSPEMPVGTLANASEMSSRGTTCAHSGRSRSPGSVPGPQATTLPSETHDFVPVRSSAPSAKRRGGDDSSPRDFPPYPISATPELADSDASPCAPWIAHGGGDLITISTTLIRGEALGATSDATQTTRSERPIGLAGQARDRAACSSDSACSAARGGLRVPGRPTRRPG
jgi:hypothetical protein